MEEILPEIETERLILSLPKNVDLDRITEILNNEVYSKNTINIPYPYTRKNAEFWLQLAKDGINNQNQYIFAIRLKENNEIIGGIDLGLNKRFNNAELGYWLDEKYWNKGYITEAVKSIIQFGFETLKLKRIFASHFDFNISSGRVLEKSGMKKEGVLKCHTCKNGQYQNHILYAIINEQM
ncbi:GNAT family N-acetyltransferase [Riemerella anatipestifer]|nr:GNAT family N-acetyltransferase [Riemerella anatipestifer]MDY3324141.1 GNAT family N-acetyltransferase [Riemerella anatipestifer]MDY3352956.1 GNAT family N-acetyltransferase [Riemerella anatipestifer]